MVFLDGYDPSTDLNVMLKDLQLMIVDFKKLQVDFVNKLDNDAYQAANAVKGQMATLNSKILGLIALIQQKYKSEHAQGLSSQIYSTSLSSTFDASLEDIEAEHKKFEERLAYDDQLDGKDVTSHLMYKSNGLQYGLWFVGTLILIWLVFQAYNSPVVSSSEVFVFVVLCSILAYTFYDRIIRSAQTYTSNAWKGLERWFTKIFLN